MKKIMTILFLCISVMMLAACGGKSGGSEISENPGDVYRAVAVDESGNPVKGVMVQFCSDELCVMGETGEDGIAVFENQEEGTYTVHVYAVPEGYAEDETEYDMPETYGDVTITIKAAG